MQDYVQTTIKPGISHHHLPRHDFLGVTHSLCTCEYSMVEFVCHHRSYAWHCPIQNFQPIEELQLSLQTWYSQYQPGSHYATAQLVGMASQISFAKTWIQANNYFHKRSQTIVIWQYFNLQCMALAQNLAITVL